jgi:hypothetical protein
MQNKENCSDEVKKKMANLYTSFESTDHNTSYATKEILIQKLSLAEIESFYSLSPKIDSTLKFFREKDMIDHVFLDIIYNLMNIYSTSKCNKYMNEINKIIHLYYVISLSYRNRTQLPIGKLFPDSYTHPNVIQNMYSDLLNAPENIKVSIKTILSYIGEEDGNERDIRQKE